ncbi:MAG TPA: hypothetical protein VMU34_10495 [Mycobacterium sp.]|nr:hypothetical protein [Mycobacterium sp.]
MSKPQAPRGVVAKHMPAPQPSAGQMGSSWLLFLCCAQRADDTDRRRDQWAVEGVGTQRALLLIVAASRRAVIVAPDTVGGPKLVAETMRTRPRRPHRAGRRFPAADGAVRASSTLDAATLSRQLEEIPHTGRFTHGALRRGAYRQMEDKKLNCVICGDRILPERAELGFTYCTKKRCVRENRAGLTVVEIGQHKTNAEYVILEGDAGEKALRDMREGKYRRDPVVVKRESRRAHFDVPKRAFAQAKIKKDPADTVKFVQALHDQGHRVDEILEKGAYMNLTRSEVVRYMSGHRPRRARR